MHKYILSVFFSFLLSLSLSAQDYSPIQTGTRLSFSYVGATDYTGVLQGENGLDTLSVSFNGGNPSYGLGMFMQFNVLPFLFIRPEAEVRLSPRKGEVDFFGNMAPQELNLRAFSFDIPIRVGYRIEGFSVQTGIGFHSRLKSKFKDSPLEELEFEPEGGFISFDLGFGYHNDVLFIDFYWEKGLKNNEGDLRYNSSSVLFSQKENYFGLKIGLALGGL